MKLVKTSLTAVLALVLAASAVGPAYAGVDPQAGPVSGGTQVAIDVPVERFRSLEAGEFGNLGVRTDGTLMGWGATHFRTAGGLNGIASPSAVPNLPPGAPRDYGLTGTTSWAVDANGKLWMWGDVPTLAGPQAAPVEVPVGGGVALKRASASRFHALAVDDAGVVWSWGNNGEGELGLGSMGVQQPTPQRAAAVNDALAAAGRHATDVVAGVNNSFVIDDAGGVWSFGANRNGMLGQSSSEQRDATPRRLDGISGSVAKLATTGYSVLALTGEGDMYTWGARSPGVLGDAGSGDRAAPGLVQALQGNRIVGFDVTPFALPHVLALTEGGEIWSWGSNRGGQLGRAVSGGADPIPGVADAPDPLAVTAVAAGAEYSLALLEDGTARAWGVDHNGSLGRGVFRDAPEPAVSGLSGVARVTFDGTGTGWVEIDGEPRITVSAPAHPSGTVDVGVKTSSSIGSGLFESGPEQTYPGGYAYEAVLSFDPQTGAAPEQVVVVDGPIVAPADPERSGHRFLGWFSEPDGGEEGLPAVPMASDATVYAHWEPVAQSGLSAQVSDLEFGQVAVGSVRSGTVTVQNDGAQKTWVRAANAEQLAGHGIALDGGESAFALEPGASKQLEVRWEPRQAGVLDTTADFTIAESAAGLSETGARTVSGVIHGDAVAGATGGGHTPGDTSTGGGGFVAETGWGSPAGIAVAAVLVVLAGGAVLLLRGRKR